MGKKNNQRIQHEQVMAANATDRQAQALELRKAGASFRDIAAATGVSVTQAYNDVEAALAESVARNADKADELRALEVERLDRLTLEAFQILTATEETNAETGAATQQRRRRPATAETRLKAIDRLVRISERRAKLQGLDMPQAFDIGDGVPLAVHFVPPLREALAALAPDDDDLTDADASRD